MAEKGQGYIAYHLEKPLVDTSKKFDKMDFIMKSIDTGKKTMPIIVEQQPNKKKTEAVHNRNKG